MRKLSVVLTVMACAAMRVDVLNNYEYGVAISSEMAAILVLAAFGVVALPAAILGWNAHFKLTTAVCVALTV